MLNQNQHLQGRRPIRQPFPIPKLRGLLGEALDNAWDVSTKKVYRSHMYSYLNFVNTHQLPLEPSEDTLALYIVFMSNHIKPSSVEVYLAGISHYLAPYYPSIRTVRQSQFIKQTLRGCMKTYNTPIHRVRALTMLEVENCVSVFTAQPSHDDLLFVSQLLIGFFALMRLGELVFPDDHLIEVQRKLSLRSTLKINNKSISFLLPFHKADTKFEGNSILVLSNPSISNPVPIMKRYISSRDSLFPNNNILWLRKNGFPPRRKWFLDRLRKVCGQDVGGHSIRSGGATFLAQCGFSMDTIQALGRWSSDTFKIYIRQHPLLLHAAIEKNKKH